MNQQEAQTTITNMIKSDPTRVINRAAAFKPEIASIIREIEQTTASNPTGLAAHSVKLAVRGADNAETIANMVKFAESF